MLPVVEAGAATILSAAVATQKAPEAPTSLITATVGFFVPETASAISCEATAEPPGEFISSMMASTEISESALSKSSDIGLGSTSEFIPIVPLIVINSDVDPNQISEL